MVLIRIPGKLPFVKCTCVSAASVASHSSVNIVASELSITFDQSVCLQFGLMEGVVEGTCNKFIICAEILIFTY